MSVITMSRCVVLAAGSGSRSETGNANLTEFDRHSGSLQELFAHSVGENNVSSAKVLYDQNGLSMGIALVTLRRPSDAKRAYHSFNDSEPVIGCSTVVDIQR